MVVYFFVKNTIEHMKNLIILQRKSIIYAIFEIKSKIDKYFYIMD